MEKLSNKQLMDINGGNFLVMTEDNVAIMGEPIDGFGTHKEAAAYLDALTGGDRVLARQLYDIVHI